MDLLFFAPKCNLTHCPNFGVHYKFIEAGKLEQITKELIGAGRFSREGEKARKDGSSFPARMLFTLTEDKNGQVIGFIEIVQDLTELKQAEEALEASKVSLRTIIEKSVDGILIVDIEGIITFVNPAAESVLGRKKEELLGEQFGFPVEPDKMMEIEIVRRDGENILAEMKGVETSWNDYPVILVSIRDITETVKLREELRSLSLSDELTGLYNRRGFKDLAEHQLKLADRSRIDKVKRLMALVYIDLDNMKQINDKLGHEEGDRMLIETAKILTKTFRNSDIIARMGGDEFAVLVLETSEAGIVNERLQKNIDQKGGSRLAPSML